MRVPLHLVERRRSELSSLIRRDGFLPVAEVCRQLHVSVATARRDLAAIAANGHITRAYGGALADYNCSFASLGERAQQAGPAKTRIARVAVAQIPRRGTIFIDAGTTALAIARALTRRRDLSGLVVATNSLAVANVLGGTPRLELHVVGGMFLHRQAVMMGSRAIRALSLWSFDTAFLGGEAMDRTGISNTHSSIAQFQQALLHRSKNRLFCLDAAKAGRATPHPVAKWAQITTLITNATLAQLASHGIGLTRSKHLQA